MKEEPRGRACCQDEAPKLCFSLFLPPGFHLSESASPVIIRPARSRVASYPTRHGQDVAHKLPAHILPPPCHPAQQPRQAVVGKLFRKTLHLESTSHYTRETAAWEEAGLFRRPARIRRHI